MSEAINSVGSSPSPQDQLRILGVFAHPDDESFCAGGTFARYTNAGAEAMVVSATRGQAGQIRSAKVATRRTLGQMREQELRLACQRLGVQHVVCLDHGDGMLKEVDQEVLIGQVVEIIRSFCPDIVITFGPDGGYGHPDHIAIGCTGYLVYLFQNNERNVRTEGLFLLSSYTEEPSARHQ
jgi:LmbE family N-acetylglucosaminyl deacetylase